MLGARALFCIALAASACGGRVAVQQAAAPLPPRVAAPPPPVPAPLPAVDPAPVTDGDVTEAWLHGMHILVKYLPGSEATATQLYVLGGSRAWTKATAGLEELGIRLSIDGGTERLTRGSYGRLLSELGSVIEGDAHSDYSFLDTWGLTPTWDETFGVLVDTFRNPALPPGQLEVTRARQLSWLTHEQDKPEAWLWAELQKSIFRGHPYENRANGSVEAVRGFTVDQVREYMVSLRQTSRLLLVVVGGIEPAHVISVATQALGDLPRGQALPTALPAFARPSQAKLNVVPAALPTNYIQAVAPGPAWHDPDFPVAMLAMSVLRWREFSEVRTKRNLAYVPDAYLATGTDVPLIALTVSATDPTATMKVMLTEARKLREVAVPEEELRGAKAKLITRLFMDSAAPNEQALQLARAQIHAGDWRLTRTLASQIRAVTPEQILTWANKDLKHLQTFVVGDETKLDRALLESL